MVETPDQDELRVRFRLEMSFMPKRDCSDQIKMCIFVVSNKRQTISQDRGMNEFFGEL